MKFCYPWLKEGRRKKEEGRGKKEEGRGKREEGRSYSVFLIYEVQDTAMRFPYPLSVLHSMENCCNSQQSTVNSQQSTVNSQQSTVNTQPFSN
ncbi:hypothetical protein H6F65_12115 [Microcoleus sp. FACHB-DQ6]|nr:hypothetical protein [Microcoleus sp. FACHB-DQ6]